MKRVLVLGATGMAGHMIYSYLDELNEYLIFSVCFRKKLNSNSVIVDVFDLASLRGVISDIKPDVVINCVGVLISGSRKALEDAIFINAYFPHMLSGLLHDVVPGSKMIHLSSDCVFSGVKGLYRDTDSKDALDVYGMTKNLGEVINQTDLCIRTSIIGPELKNNGEGLFHWLFMQKNNSSIRGYTKSFWSGLTTLELAKAIAKMIDEDVIGLFQLSNGQKISKHDLLGLINEEYSLDISINPTSEPEIDKSIVPTVYSEFEYSVPTYRTMVSELHEYMLGHASKYEQYRT